MNTQQVNTEPASPSTAQDRIEPGRTGRASVLFVSVRNGGKSQMAAGLLRHLAPEIDVHSAGTDPGTNLNALSVQVLGEVGADLAGEHPRPISPDLLARVDLVVVLGREAHLDAPAGVQVRVWDTDEPSLRGVEGVERMRLIRDDITSRVHDLRSELRSASAAERLA